MKVKEESGKASLKFNIQKTKIMASSPISSVQSLRHVWLCNPVDCNMPGFPVHHQLPEPTQTHVHWVGDANYLILCCPLLLLPSIFPSIRVFSSELALHIRWPKYWSLQHQSFQWNPGLISFRMNWLDLLAVQGTLRSLFQQHNLKASVLQCSAFFMVQL